MRQTRRILLTVAALLIPVGGLTLGVSGVAGAATGKITCTSISGNDSSTTTISGCTGGNTGGGSEPLSSADLATGGTIDWVSGSTTTIGAPALTTASATKCPGYNKKATSNPAAETFTASVNGDTGDGMLIPGSVTGTVCVGTDGTITAAKAIKFTWTESTISCSSLSGSETGSTTVGGCTGGDTGGGSKPLSSATLANGGTIEWLSGSTTTIGAPTLTATSAKACPGYSKTATVNPVAEKFTAPVTGDSGDGLKLPGTAKGAVCIGTDGSITALKPLTAK